jgi:hypothetical protein
MLFIVSKCLVMYKTRPVSYIMLGAKQPISAPDRITGQYPYTRKPREISFHQEPDAADSFCCVGYRY